MQIGMVVFTYMAAYAFMYLISLGLINGRLFADTIKPLICGFNFLIGTVMAILFKLVLRSSPIRASSAANTSTTSCCRASAA